MFMAAPSPNPSHSMRFVKRAEDPPRLVMAKGSSTSGKLSFSFSVHCLRRNTHMATITMPMARINAHHQSTGPSQAIMMYFL